MDFLHNEELEIKICRVLDFIAESVNIYNWNLLRVSNPEFIMYDVTNETKNKFFNTIMTNENSTYIFSMLKLTLKSLHIIADADGYDFVTLAELFAIYIQERQKKLHETGHYYEVESLLTYEIDEDSDVKPELYLELSNIEKHNIDLNSNYNTVIRRNLYNNVRSAYNITDDFINYSHPIFENGEEYIDEIELELLYHNTPIIHITMRKKSTKAESFECPICYEKQSSSQICITLNCHHIFCKSCFQGIIDSRTILCAMCRCPITECEEREII